MDTYEPLAECEGFDWDDGNSSKNWEKHRVGDSECEQNFFNVPLVLAADKPHSQSEKRFYALGRSDTGRQLFVAFTIRNAYVRIISARQMTQREREVYKHAKPEN